MSRPNGNFFPGSRDPEKKASVAGGLSWTAFPACYSARNASTGLTAVVRREGR